MLIYSDEMIVCFELLIFPLIKIILDLLCVILMCCLFKDSDI